MAASSARQSQRVLIDAPVRLTLREASRTLPARALDLSEGGIRLSADATLSVGDEVTCSLELDNERAALNGRVRWSKPPTVPAGAMGFGVQFGPLDDAQLGQLRRWLAHNSDHAEVVLLHVPSMREPLRARGCVTADGLQLVAALPQLAPGSELEFQLGDTGSRRLGRIERIDVKPRSEHGALELALRLQPTAATRSRRNLVYGLGEFENVEYGAAALRPTPAASAPPVPLVPLGSPGSQGSQGPPPSAASTTSVLSATPSIVIDTTGISTAISTTQKTRRRARAQTMQIPKSSLLRLLRWGVGFAAASGAALWLWKASSTPADESEQAGVEDTAIAAAATSISAATTPRALAPAPAPAPTPAPTEGERTIDPPPQPLPATPAQPPASQDLATTSPRSTNSQVGNDETRLPALNSEGAKSEIFVPMQGSLEGLRTTQWTDPLAVVLDIPGAHFATPELLKGLRGGGVKRVRLDETRPVPRLQIFLNTVAARFAAKAVPHGLLVVLEHDLQPLPH
ncbi:MAG TPA: PilZ domain-containing protein [Polyangiales bacterium]|nr:PilZ domain-containing protein [Polyangiales bacterium]